MSAVLDPPPGDAFHLSPHSIVEMLHPHVKASETTSWALGWAIQHTENGNFTFHSGGNDGFVSFAHPSVFASPR